MVLANQIIIENGPKLTCWPKTLLLNKCNKMQTTVGNMLQKQSVWPQTSPADMEKRIQLPMTETKVQKHRTQTQLAL